MHKCLAESKNEYHKELSLEVMKKKSLNPINSCNANKQIYPCIFYIYTAKQN